MKTWFVVFLLLGFYGSANVFGVDPNRVRVTAAPPVIYRPQVTMVPYQLDRTEVTPRVYHTPLRNLLFGRQRVTHVYRPQVTQ